LFPTFFQPSSLHLFQDLQGEIDTERENFLSLTASGRKLLTNLNAAAAASGAAGGSNEDADTLKNKLEEMNERWNYLKAKSVAIR
jgi:DNA-binding MarR family transcriptional regulator